MIFYYFRITRDDGLKHENAREQRSTTFNMSLSITR